MPKAKGSRKSAPAGKTRKKALRTKPARQAQKTECKFIPWNTVEVELLNPLLARQVITGQNIMISRVYLKKGSVVPEHHHVNEQVTYILEGSLKFWIDGKVIVLNEGDVLTIPSNMPHKAKALVDTIDLDVFNPPRADWLNKTDKYLRGK